MAYTEFYTDPTNGANVNAGDGPTATPTMSDTAGTGSWSTVTNQYTSVATNGTVAVGQFMTLYTGAATVPLYTARITVVSGGSGSVWVITLSTTAISGSRPATNTNFKAQVGGYMKGPNAAEVHPFGYITNAQTNSTGNPPRVNMINNATYSITTTLTYNATNINVMFQGCTTTAGDGGKATIDGSTNVIDLITATTRFFCADLILQNNGASGTKAGINANNATTVFRCVFNNLRGPGLLNAGNNVAKECEFYACNTSNTITSGAASDSGGSYEYCVFHDNTGSNNNGLKTNGGTVANCIFDTNANDGILLNGAGPLDVLNCDFYNNGRDGIEGNSTSSQVTCSNSNFVKNGRYGLEQVASAVAPFQLFNNGYGTGTQVNVSGTTSGLSIQEIGAVTYASGVTPWVDPANGDFRINLAAAENTGRGAFTETAASYAGTVGYPDIGAATHAAVAAGGAYVFGG